MTKVQIPFEFFKTFFSTHILLLFPTSLNILLSRQKICHPRSEYGILLYCVEVLIFCLFLFVTQALAFRGVWLSEQFFIWPIYLVMKIFSRNFQMMGWQPTRYNRFCGLIFNFHTLLYLGGKTLILLYQGDLNDIWGKGDWLN